MPSTNSNNTVPSVSAAINAADKHAENKAPAEIGQPQDECIIFGGGCGCGCCTIA